MLKINELARLYLGIQGENGVRSITVDVSAWINLYPNGSVTVWHKRCGDSTPSPTGAVYDSEEQTVTWDITSVDTFVAGIGEAEFRLIENDVIKKTAKVMTGVSPAVTLAGTELGSDWASYINAVDSLRAGAVVAQEAAEDAQEAAEGAQTAAETAQGKAEDAQTAAEAAAARAEHASKVMVPAGGTEGQRLAKKSGTDFDMEWKTDPYYTKPAGGIPASDMAEGAIPDPTSIIDGNSTAANKVWPASKTNDLLSAIVQLGGNTPENYGAKGDGVTDDSSAIQQAINSGYEVHFGDNKTYYVPSTITITHDTHLIGGKNTKIKTVTQNGSLNNVFVFNGTLKKTTTLTTDYTSDGNTDNSGNMFTLADMSGINAGDIMVVKAEDQYYSYTRQYYYLGMTLLIGDKDNSHIYTTESMPWDMELTEDVSVKVYSAPTVIIENLNFVADRESIGGYKFFVSLNACKNSVIRNCGFSEMDNGILINHSVNTLIDRVSMSDGKNDNTIPGDGYGIEVDASTNTFIQGINAICAQTPITTGGDVVVVNLYVRDCDLTSQCRHHGIGMHENSYNIVVEDCTLGGLNVLGTGTVNRCRFINNRRLGSNDGGITFCGSHNPKFATLRVNDCTFEGGSFIYVYSPSTQEPVEAFDCIVGLVDIRDCNGGYLCFDGTVTQYILSNKILEMNLVGWKNCNEFYIPHSTDIIEKMTVSCCEFKDVLWINDHNNHLMTANVHELDISSVIPMQHKLSVNKDTYGERYTLPENVSISLSATNSSAKYIVCGNNLASNDPADYFFGSVSGSDGGTLSRTVSTGGDVPTLTTDNDGNLVHTQKNNSISYDLYPVGLFYVREPSTIYMSAKLKNTGETNPATFRPYMAIVDCDTGKLIARYLGTAVAATAQGATISYSHSAPKNSVAMCYYYCNSPVANAETTFEDMSVIVENYFVQSTSDSIQPYEAKRRTGDGTVLSLPGVNNIMCSDLSFHVSFGADFVENPVGLLPSGSGVSF